MRLICFGDSWTAGHGVEQDVDYKEEATPPLFIQKLREQNSWPRWVAEKLKCPYVNNGICGLGNKYIYNELYVSLKNGFIYQDDIIIIMFSWPYRYMNYDSETVIEIYKMMEHELNGIKHFYFNSFYPSFKDYDYDTKFLPNYFINPDGCVSDILREYEMKNNVGVWEYGSRSIWNDEKNYYEGDYHPNLLGYQVIGDYVYNNIKDKI